MTKSACPYSTGAPPATRTSRISPSAGALISATRPRDWIPPRTSPRATASPVVHSRAALNTPTVVACTRCVFSVGPCSRSAAGAVAVPARPPHRVTGGGAGGAGGQKVGSGEAHRDGRALRLAGASPEDRRATLG